jgi:osmotically-inducible protein OsmY
MKTDIQLQHDVLAELAWQPSINAADIGVQAKDGIVTLAGHVSSYAEKWDAERAAQQVEGVRALAVEMDVRLPGASRRNDVDIARAVQNALLWSIAVPREDAIRVVVEAGHVTLSGEVAWAYQRAAAVEAVRYLMGVTGVSDQIVVKPRVGPGAIKDEIEASLQRRAHHDASRIAVAVEGSAVTLSGVVAGWAERELACHSAWGTAGVHIVIDNMTVR